MVGVGILFKLGFLLGEPCVFRELFVTLIWLVLGDGGFELGSFGELGVL